ncbi:ABC transporter ATP-binding protein [Bordetella trematum]|uniref:Branched-chain amino acid ABC transporter ATP-binding protein n=1 Tax=Bordetella trematum TaxID=123899 RepID=A0A157SEV8_9BORD|nr:ABC transporter ATP-binding protein [Bordetella trematum]AZR92359.1 ABC transporter ATP-binding protein [Bordetella trematum]NNH20655.1 ABC transporter ATP-binding protein [Bordetella trematum]SAI57808.1 branched-chain amino acid ABC transporter ATP-binding protein [Bordetella trematum]SAI68456.1 branched-chain amino acid ABC transporter ATP-binding protein [Bordetella trematum]SUW00025.1 branched-chain amino acid ABC transporter ATP-binding protein [Bordetella trematum]
MLETRSLTIRFGGHTAVDDVSARYAPGSLTAIVGPNGAGKTTYFNLISGQLRASQGSVLLDGSDLTHQGAAARMHAGLGRAFQLTQLFPQLSTHENLRLALQSRKQGAGWRHIRLWRSWRAERDLIEQADTLLERVRLQARRDHSAASLPHGDQRKLEIAMLAALRPKVFMFDEPTAGMSVDDVPVVLDLIRELKQDRSKIILLVEHKMDVVRELADRIVVLHNGRLMADGLPAEIMASPLVQQAYLGTGAPA